MRRLWDVLLEHNVNPADSGWTSLNQAAAITPDGNVIVGFGIRNGNQEAYRAVLEAGTTCPPCAADFNQDGGVDGNDVGAFFDEWEGGGGCADANQDGGIDGADVDQFFTVWEQGSC
jgi:hypothetical protein